jgi:curved DNA-binding protein CbpA
MGSPDFDPYATLGVVPSATPDEIRAAYRRLAAACHPDTQPPEKKDWASERMIQLNAARDLLLNTRRRVQYHQAHADHLQWSAEKTRWQTKEAQAAYGRTQPPAADRPSRRMRDQIYTLILSSLAGLVILGGVVVLGLGKNLAALVQTQWESWTTAVQQGNIWMAAIGHSLVAALQCMFFAGFLVVALLGLTRWWKR